MRKLRNAIILSLFILLTGALSCGQTGQSTSVNGQKLFTVIRGDLFINVKGTGHIETTREVRLSFSTSGKIDKVYVEEGDSVNQGDVLAQIETDALELALSEAIVNHEEAQIAVFEMEINLKNAEIALEKAQDTYKWPELEVAEADVEEAETNLQYAIDHGYEALILRYSALLEAAEKRLNAMLSGADPDEVVIKKLQLEKTNQSLELAERSLELANQSLNFARKQLDEAAIVAPFRGIVASIDTEEGDVIIASNPVVHLVDLAILELLVEIDEMDIAKVEQNQEVIVHMDALPETSFEGVVNTIYPLPAQTTGLVMYNVKITIELLEKSDIKVGMRAIADIVIDKKSNILKIPSQAIKQDSTGRHIVQVLEGNKLLERIITTGISNGFETEIISGLSENEVVAY